MTNKFSKFTSIGRFRQIKMSIEKEASFDGIDKNGEAMYKKNYTLPILKFHGTIKCHGTNAGVAMDNKGNLTVLSRKRVIDIENDNCGFAAFVKKNEVTIKSFFLAYSRVLKENQQVVIYGEWCGKGIKNGVAISELEKLWIIFAVKIVPIINADEEIDASFYVPCNGINSPMNRIFNITEFKTFNIEIDFNHPTAANNKIVELVAEVENCCPVGSYFSVMGVGEGIVWSNWRGGKRQHIFKTKGEKHANAKSKVKVLKIVDSAFEQKKIDFINNFACKEFRLVQMYDEVFNVLNGGKGSIERTGDYIKAVIQDVIKEEGDVMVNEGLTTKDISKLISRVARNYFLNRLDEDAGI